VTVSDKGTGQGSVISPLLANAYLQYSFDLWAERWRRCEAAGDMIIVRYADDIVVGFEQETDARRFWDAMRDRLRQTGAGMACSTGVPDQAAFHSVLLPASQSDRAVVGPHAQKRHAQQMLRNMRPIR
jgi:hypothetical protein